MSEPGKRVEMLQVIRTTLSLRGKGTPESPMRRLTQYWSLDGELLAENDPAQEFCCDVGHRVLPNARECERCGAKLSERKDGTMP